MQTPTQLLEEYSLELSGKANKFFDAFGFYPAREGSAAYYALPLLRQNLSHSFFVNTRIRQIETLISTYGEHCHSMKVKKGN